MKFPISPLDGRYANSLEAQGEYFSEYALMKARCIVEAKYSLALNNLNIFEEKLSPAEITALENIINNFSWEDYQSIKNIEAETRHDVKACEIFLREKTKAKNEAIFHFALTSEDINNLAYNILMKEYVEKIHLPQLKEILKTLGEKAALWKDKPFPTHTHGQKASPSTAGKELAVFINRLLPYVKALSSFRFYGKLNGAVGNFSAMYAACPHIDWISFSKNFIQSLGLEMNLCTTQIEPHDYFANYFNIARQINNIILDLNTDCWLYISYGFFSEESKKKEVGSSTMPHKVNPINFENSEGNIAISNSLLAMMADKLCRSRMQRDLSDSTVLRNVGVALSHAYLATNETMKGLNKLKFNEAFCLDVLAQSPEVLAEPIQTILKLANIPDPYTLLKEHTRGQKTTQAMLFDLVKSLDIAEKYKTQIFNLRPENYIGAAAGICQLVLDELKIFLERE